MVHKGSGTANVRPLWGGKAQIDEVEIDLPSGRIQGMTLRLYQPESRQWNLYWVSQKVGRIDVPTVGEFKDGRGEFYDQELYEGRSILVRYVWSNITPKSASERSCQAGYRSAEKSESALRKLRKSFAR